MAVWSDVEMNGVEQVRRMTALRVAQSSLTSGWCSAEPSFASSSASSLPCRPQWPGTHRTSRHLSALLLLVLLFNHRKGLRMIQRSACARVRKCVSSSMDAQRSNLLWSASKAGQRSYKWSYVSYASLQIRHVASSDRLIRYCQRRRAG